MFVMMKYDVCSVALCPAGEGEGVRVCVLVCVVL